MIFKNLSYYTKKSPWKFNDARPTGYVNETFINETGHLIDYVIQVCDMPKINGYLQRDHRFYARVLIRGQEMIIFLKTLRTYYINNS